jgi:hypothetical protein
MTKLERAAAVVLACALVMPLYSPASPAAGGSRYVDLDRFPKPRITGKQIIAGLERGTQNTFRSAYYTALVLDNL